MIDPNAQAAVHLPARNGDIIDDIRAALAPHRSMPDEYRAFYWSLLDRLDGLIADRDRYRTAWTSARRRARRARVDVAAERSTREFGEKLAQEARDERDEALRVVASLRLDLKHTQSSNDRLRRIIMAAEKDVADLKGLLTRRERKQGVGPFLVGDRVRRRGRDLVQTVTGVVQCGPNAGHIYVDAHRRTGRGPADPAEYESVAPAAPADEDECGRCGGAGIDPADSTAEAPCVNCRVPHDGAASRLDWQRIYGRGYADARTAAERQAAKQPGQLVRPDSDLRAAVRALHRRYGGAEVARELYRQAEQDH